MVAGAVGVLSVFVTLLVVKEPKCVSAPVLIHRHQGEDFHVLVTIVKYGNVTN